MKKIILLLAFIIGFSLSLTMQADAAPSCTVGYYIASFPVSSIHSGDSATLSWSSVNDADGKLEFNCTNFSCSGNTCTYNGSGRSGVVNTNSNGVATWNNNSGSSKNETCTFTAVDTGGSTATCSATLAVDRKRCNSSTPCDESDNGQYCRSIDGGAYQWINPITCTESNFCQRYSCGGESGICHANATSFFWDSSRSTCPYSISMSRVGNPYCFGKSVDLTTTADLPGAIYGLRAEMYQTSGPTCYKAYCSPNSYDLYMNNIGSYSNYSGGYTKTNLGGGIYRYQYNWFDSGGNATGQITSSNCGPNEDYPEGSFMHRPYIGKISKDDPITISCSNCGGPPTYSCTGARPSGTTVCSNDEVGLPSNVSWLNVGSSAGCTNARKCEYYPTPTYSCTGTRPSGTTVCSNDEVGLPSNISWLNVGSSAGCTNARKCEYYVPSSIINGSCGGNAQSYSSATTAWPDPTPNGFCQEGTPNPLSPTFPSVGSSTSWTCNGSSGGTTANCSAQVFPPGSPKPPSGGSWGEIKP
jgi:hypothetical protein